MIWVRQSPSLLRKLADIRLRRGGIQYCSGRVRLAELIVHDIRWLVKAYNNGPESEDGKHSQANAV